MTLRQYTTDTPGLAVVKIRSEWTVVHASSGEPAVRSPIYNRFRRLGDAQAAAARLAPLLDWTRPVEELAPLIGSHAWTSTKEAALDALTDLTAEEREAERERRRQERTGEADREVVDAAARRLDHELTWRHYGARSWRGTCRRCGAEVRVAYCPCRRRHELRGECLMNRCRAPG